ncbi:hypothetical protein [Polynucleobacter sinensis]|uniref:hypothetical protein n=1 Tax=Polynucleobacter sinensis TaxID=1743157 RepID=UPI000783E1A5|nr:hypothetical protein [Polynucleobacter sinensis]
MNSQKSTGQLTSDLTKAFDRLPIKDDQANHLNNLIQVLANGASNAVHTPYSNHFIDKPATLIPELEGLLKRTRDLEQFLSKIHQSTILAIPDVNARAPLEHACQRMIPALENALNRIASNDEGQEKDMGGRPVNYRSIQLADILAMNYKRLTGKTPTITVDPISVGNVATGEFFTFFKSVFNILGAKGNAEYFARLAIDRLNPQKEITPP